MNKKIIFGLIAIIGTTSAQAGLLDMLGFKKTEKPTTLAQACNKDEITRVCPELIAGDQTIPECLVNNLKSVSKKCAKYVKDAIKNQAAEVKESVGAVKADVKDVASEKIADAVEKKNNAVATAQEIKEVANQVKVDAHETGVAFKEIFNSDAK